MNEKIDVLEVFGKMRSNSYCWDFAQKDAAYAADQSAIADDAIAAVAELIKAASDYYHGYCVDEAGDDGVEWTGCTEDQHQKAKQLKLVLARIGAA